MLIHTAQALTSVYYIILNAANNVARPEIVPVQQLDYWNSKGDKTKKVEDTNYWLWNYCNTVLGRE